MKLYSPRSYWEARIGKRFDLTGAGHSALGPNYNAYLYKRRLESLEEGLRYVGQSPAKARILEVGCGTGFYTSYFTQKEISEYIGLDITTVSVKTLTKRFPSARFICADVSKFKAVNTKGFFDIIFAADVLFHIVEDSLFEQAIQNMATWLKEGGLLVISDVFPEHTVQVADHVCLRSLGYYREILEYNHIRIRHIEPIFALLHPPSAPAPIRWWQLYESIWKLEQRIVKHPLVDQILPKILAWVDHKFFLPRYGTIVPNNKWLFACKDEFNL